MWGLRGGRPIRLAVLGALLSAVAAPQLADAREPLDIRLFARVGHPGQPEAIAVGRDHTVYVGTNQQQRGDTGAPSRIFAYAPSGTLLRDYTIAGQDLNEDHGIQSVAMDGDGLLYALDRSARPRVIRLDPRTGEQRDYASFHDVPTCAQAGRSTDCSDTVGDMESGPNTAAFGPDGSLYVTDIDQALIWRVRPGGGSAEVFFTDRRLENLFGPNGIQLLPDGRTLMFAVTAQSPTAGNPTVGRLFKLPILPSGRPGELEDFWASRPFDGPDGFAIGASGKVYLALSPANQLAVISPAGVELARVPDPVANRQMDPPVDAPASVAFLGDSVLVTNQSFPAGNPDHWAVLDVFAGEPGQPLFRPHLSGSGNDDRSRRARPRLSLRLTYRHKRGRCAMGRVRATLLGRGVRGVTFRLDGRRVARDRRPPFRAIVYRRRGGHAGTHRVRAVAALDGGSPVAVSGRVRTCPARSS